MKSFTRHSPSSLNLFAASPALFVLEKIMGHRQPGNAPMYRGTAVEDGVTHGLMNPAASPDECNDVAFKKYDTISALSSDKRREEYRATIPAMVQLALEELRPYGIPTDCQKFVEWRPKGLVYPIVGYLDYHWSDHNITIDLKTSEKMPSAVKVAHARQISLYVTSNNADARACYVTPKKHTTYQIENVDAHRNALHQMALRCEAFLALSEDPEFFKSITIPDLDSFYWAGPARELAFQHWKI
ncbi:MAG: PD-(D/E)XK nuclease family protein [Pyrinomonadaceae bacterium]|nr:PD-(D/E)XK nuclease family protein [Pyrinomonadaceae bacterium]